MNGCDENDYTITPFRVNNEMQYAVAVVGGEFLAFCTHESSAIAVREDAIQRAKKQGLQKRDIDYVY